MIIDYFEKYTFNNSDVQGIKILLNFSLNNNLEIIMHEETQGKYEQTENINKVKEFPPLLFSVDLDSREINSLNIPNEINKLTLLDGHHRLEHLSLYNYDHFVPIVLISNQDVKVESYKSGIDVDENTFVEILNMNNFKNSNSSDYFILFQNSKYCSGDVENIYDLYDFKRKLISSNMITPVQNDHTFPENRSVDFTPVKLSEFYKENYLFPPKSTWISPRI